MAEPVYIIDINKYLEYEFIETSSNDDGSITNKYLCRLNIKGVVDDGNYEKGTGMFAGNHCFCLRVGKWVKIDKYMKSTIYNRNISLSQEELELDKWYFITVDGNHFAETETILADGATSASNIIKYDYSDNTASMQNNSNYEFISYENGFLNFYVNIKPLQLLYNEVSFSKSPSGEYDIFGVFRRYLDSPLTQKICFDLFYNSSDGIGGANRQLCQCPYILDEDIITRYNLNQYKMQYDNIPVISTSLEIEEHTYNSDDYIKSLEINIQKVKLGDFIDEKWVIKDYIVAWFPISYQMFTFRNISLIRGATSDYFINYGDKTSLPYNSEFYYKPFTTFLFLAFDVDYFNQLPTGDGSVCTIDELIPPCQDKDRYEISIEAFTKWFYELNEDSFIVIEGITTAYPIEDVKDLNNFNILGLITGFGTTWI